jgi:hypothetical protein
MSFKNHLAYRLVIFNACAAAVLGWAAIQGYVQEIVAGDTSGITYAIIALFLIGMWSIGARTLRVTRHMNGIKRGEAVDVSAAKFLAKGEHIDDISGWLVTLGLLGTVVGFIMALTSMDQSALTTAGGVQQSIGQLVGGMKVAIFTTLSGGICGLWLDINRRILRTATVCMLEDAA